MTSVRSDEDYSYLRDPNNRSGFWWEPFKYVPLDRTGEIYVTFGEEERLRFERYHNNEFGSARKPDENYFRYRMLPYADLHIGPHFRFFGQVQGAWSTRSEETKNPFTDETGLDSAQAFLDWRLPRNEQELIFRAGRQVLEYGSQRLISSGPNIRFMFDGGGVRWKCSDWHVDALVVRPVNPGLDSFDDRADRTRSLGLVYATHALPGIGPASGVDLYYMHYENDAGVFNQGAGPERRHTVGVRFFGTSEPWKWDVEANVQPGDFAGADIRAGSIDVAVGRTFEVAPGKPYIEMRANAISGDQDPQDNRLETFNAMFPTGLYFGDIGQLGPANLYNLRPNFALELSKDWRLSGAGTFFWRKSVNDGIYGPALNVVRTSGNSRARVT